MDMFLQADLLNISFTLQPDLSAEQGKSLQCLFVCSYWVKLNKKIKPQTDLFSRAKFLPGRRVV